MTTSPVDKFLAKKAETFKTRPVAKASLIFGLDATGSREHTWDMAMHTQVEMFHEAGRVGALSTLDIQLVYFRGTLGANAECKASNWMSSPTSLASYMATIKCMTGLTQIERILRHAIREASQRTVGAVVFVGDCCEESQHRLESQALALAELKVPLFLFQEGNDHDANQAFKLLALITNGAHLKFDAGSAKQLGELLRAVAAFTVGGRLALQNSGSGAARLLLGQMK